MVIPLGNERKTRTIAWLSFFLIAINALCFVVELFEPNSFVIAYATTPYEITHQVDLVQPRPVRSAQESRPFAVSPRADDRELIHQRPGPKPIWLTLITGLFFHASLAHLAGNLLFLFIFGQRVEEALGRVAFLTIYLVAGIVGTLAQILVDPESVSPIIGASGAIAGIMGSYLVWFPLDRVRVLVVNLLFSIPAFAVIGGWLLFQLIYEFAGSNTGDHPTRVAYLAHLGGATTGVCLSLVIWAGSLTSKVWSDCRSTRLR